MSAPASRAGQALHLRRIDDARNMARFYAMDVQPDLFGCILLVKAWGRIGGRGRVVHELHPTEAQARAALQRQAERKRRFRIRSRFQHAFDDGGIASLRSHI